MSMRRIGLALLASLLLVLAGCRQEGPLERVRQSAGELQAALERKDKGAVMELLHGDFLAQNEYRQDWAQRSLTLYFLRHKQIGVSVLNQDSTLDESYSDRAETHAQVLLTGGSGLLPERADGYQVKLQWWLEDGDWKLARLDWE